MRFEVIPAIDIRGGRCVRLFQGDYARETVYDADPVAVAQRWEQAGARRLHVVDLDGARDGRPAHLDLLRRIAEAISIPVQVGGGLRNRESVAAALDAGAQRAIVGTAALEPASAGLLIKEFSDRLVVGIDSRDGRVAVHGWVETSGRETVEAARELEAAGAVRIIFTDISRDGTLTGPAVERTQELARSVNIPVIASGGVAGEDDIRTLARLGPDGVEGVIVGRALYTGALEVTEWVRG